MVVLILVLLELSLWGIKGWFKVYIQYVLILVLLELSLWGTDEATVPVVLSEVLILVLLELSLWEAVARGLRMEARRS